MGEKGLQDVKISILTWNLTGMSAVKLTLMVINFRIYEQEPQIWKEPDVVQTMRDSRSSAL